MADEYLTTAEIYAKYPNEWVLIDRPTTKRRSLKVTGGYVAFHCADRREFLHRVGEFTAVTEGAVLFAGKFVEDIDEVELEPVPVEQR